jgi:hypothetical protein
LEIELSDFDAENETLNADNMWQVVQIVIGGFPTILEVGLMCVFISLCRILLQESVMMNIFGPMRHEVDLHKVEVGI